MKLLFMGDLHLTASIPESRIDNFLETQSQKLDEIFDIGYKYHAPIIATGDLFDRPTPPISLLAKYIGRFIKYNLEGPGIYVVPGNHDVYGAQIATLPNTALGLFAKSGAVHLLNAEPTFVSNNSLDQPSAYIVGTSYFNPVDLSSLNIVRQYSGDVCILVSHAMILEDKVWREQEDFTYAHQYLERYANFDVILCGHYHYRFASSFGNRLICNPGAVVRVKASKGDMELAPGIFLYDIKERHLELILINSKPVKEVFQKKIKPATTYESAALDEFVDSLSEEVAASSYSTLADIIIQEIQRVGCPEDISNLVRTYISKAEQKIQAARM